MPKNKKPAEAGILLILKDLSGGAKGDRTLDLMIARLGL